jgi:predicted metal-dependent hydrolase
MQLSLLETPEHGRAVPWRFRVSGRARRLAIRIYAGGRIDIVVPRGVHADEIRRFVAQHRDWIERHAPAAPPVAPLQLPTEIGLAVLGGTVQIEYRQAPGRASASAGAGGRLTIATPDVDQASRIAALVAWLKGRFRASVARRLDAIGARTGLAYRRIEVRQQRTRWGSCSARGTLSINVAAAFLPLAVIDYLLLHELCHTRHMNHSKRFWALVEQFEPDYRRLDRELAHAWRHLPTWIVP